MKLRETTAKKLAHLNRRSYHAAVQHFHLWRHFIRSVSHRSVQCIQFPDTLSCQEIELAFPLGYIAVQPVERKLVSVEYFGFIFREEIWSRNNSGLSRQC
jgi:hypothetical protein